MNFIGHIRRRLLGGAKRLYLSNPIRRRPIDRQLLAELDRQGTDTERAIIFVVPGFDRVDGGLLSIASLAEESRNLHEMHGAQVYVCPLPGDPPVAQFTKFDNTMRPVPYRPLITRLAARRAEVLLHVPECYVPVAVRRFGLDRLARGRIDLRVNVILANIDLAPSPAEMEALKRHAPVTITTAHKAYSGAETADRLGAPVLHLSVWVCPERYVRSAWTHKRNLVLLSPDPHPERRGVLETLSRALPEYEFVTIRNLPYRAYRALCSEAKLAITFGEGLDGYYIEPIFSGGLAAAVYNDRFFTPKYRGLPLMYPDWPTLARNLPADFRALDNPESFARVNDRLFEVPASDYRGDEYVANLRRFYETVFPAPGRKAAARRSRST